MRRTAPTSMLGWVLVRIIRFIMRFGTCAKDFYISGMTSKSRPNCLVSLAVPTIVYHWESGPRSASNAMSPPSGGRSMNLRASVSLMTTQAACRRGPFVPGFSTKPLTTYL
jgi:hypothetical protein